MYGCDTARITVQVLRRRTERGVAARRLGLRSGTHGLGRCLAQWTVLAVLRVFERVTLVYCTGTVALV